MVPQETLFPSFQMVEKRVAGLVQCFAEFAADFGRAPVPAPALFAGRAKDFMGPSAKSWRGSKWLAKSF